jgi:hypothetical protein
MTRLTLFLTAVIACLCWPLAAQEKPEEKISLKLDRVQFDDLTWSDPYPNIAGLRGVGGGSNEKWKRLAVRGELAHEGKASDSHWLDDMECHWTVILQGDTPEASLHLERTVTYTNVEASGRGKTIYFLAFIPPDVVRRFAGRSLKDDQIMFTLTIKWGDKTRAWAWYGNKNLELTQTTTNKELSAWIASERPKVLRNGLLHRLETPWSYASFDLEALPRIVPGAN